MYLYAAPKRYKKKHIRIYVGIKGAYPIRVKYIRIYVGIRYKV